MRTLISLLALLFTASCAPMNREPTDASPVPAEAGGDTVVGTVRVVGSAPMNVQVVVQPEEGPSVTVAGSLAGELRSLSGVEVAVTGERDGRTIRPTSYEIRSVNGEPVTFGTVGETTANGWVELHTPTGEVIYLTGAADRFRPGQRVWVQGPQAVVVQSYGVVRP
jgi:hypothetical protein